MPRDSSIKSQAGQEAFQSAQPYDERESYPRATQVREVVDVDLNALPGTPAAPLAPEIVSGLHVSVIYSIVS